MSRRPIVALLLIVFISSCKTDTEQEVQAMPENGVARAYDRVLTAEEVMSVVPDKISEEDSLLLAKRYVNEWLKEQVILYSAERNLPEQRKNFEREMEQYRRTLLTYAYENLYVQQRLDTVVSQEEIEAYYEQNKEIFTLKDYIVKTKFCILEEDTPRKRKFKKLFDSNEGEDLVKLEQFCIDYGAAYYVDVETWMYLEDLLVQMPLDVYNIESFLRTKPSTDFITNGKHYFVNILDYKQKDGVSPLTLVEDQIRNLILNKRKKALLTEMREALYKNAVAEGQIEKLNE